MLFPLLVVEEEWPEAPGLLSSPPRRGRV